MAPPTYFYGKVSLRMRMSGRVYAHSYVCLPILIELKSMLIKEVMRQYEI
jgi:hypothetical protein